MRQALHIFRKDVRRLWPQILIVLALTLVLSFVAGNTTFGRHLYAIGGNAEAARLSGISVPRHTFGLFIVMGVMTALAHQNGYPL